MHPCIIHEHFEKPYMCIDHACNDNTDASADIKAPMHMGGMILTATPDTDNFFFAGNVDRSTIHALLGSMLLCISPCHVLPLTLSIDVVSNAELKFLIPSYQY